MRRDLLVDRLFHHAATRPRDPALHALISGEKGAARFETCDFGSYERRVRAFAAACVAAGLPAGGVVALLSDNCPDWLVAALGAQVAGGVIAGIYQNSSAEQVRYVLDHSQAHLLVIDSEAQWRKLHGVLAALPRLQRVIFIGDAAPPADEPRCQRLADFVALGKDHESAAMARAAAIQPSDLASLIYTSGTTGVPKGVMLTHHNLAWTSQHAIEMLGHVGPNERVLSYLPLAHIAEQMFSLYLAVYCGYQVYFAGGFDRIREALALARPTIFLGVPRVWEKLRAALVHRFAEASGRKARLLRWAREVGLSAGRERLQRGAPTGLLWAKEQLAERLVLRRVRAALGFDELRLAITGSAPTSPDVMEFFLGLGLPLHEVYGQSETSGPTTFNRPQAGMTRLGTVGLPVPGVQVKVAADGEILVRGDNVFQGYFKDPAATAEALVDGWLHSGDVGEFDSGGFLRITDRKKDLIKTSGGKYAAPQPIEKRLQDIPGVGHAAVIGEGRKYLTAVLTLEPQAAQAFARAQGLLPGVEGAELLQRLSTHPALLAHIQEGVDRLNRDLSRPETIKRFAVLPTEFTVEGGELTPSQKLRRREVERLHRDAIEALYPDKD